MLDINLTCKIDKKLDICYKKYGKYMSFSEAMSNLKEKHKELCELNKKKNLNLDKIETGIIDTIVILNKMYFDIVVAKNNNSG